MKQDVIELDGVIGGGQVLRSGVSLSMVTGRTLCIRNIRAKRSQPGVDASTLDGRAGSGPGVWRAGGRR